MSFLAAVRSATGQQLAPPPDAKPIVMLGAPASSGSVGGTVLPPPTSCDACGVIPSSFDHMLLEPLTQCAVCRQRVCGVCLSGLGGDTDRTAASSGEFSTMSSLTSVLGRLIGVGRALLFCRPPSCARCLRQAEREDKFQQTKIVMERGTTCEWGSSSCSTKFTPAFLQLEDAGTTLAIASLERRANRPVSELRLGLGEVLLARGVTTSAEDGVSHQAGRSHLVNYTDTRGASTAYTDTGVGGGGASAAPPKLQMEIVLRGGGATAPPPGPRVVDAGGPSQTLGTTTTVGSVFSSVMGNLVGVVDGVLASNGEKRTQAPVRIRFASAEETHTWIRHVNEAAEVHNAALEVSQITPDGVGGGGVHPIGAEKTWQQERNAARQLELADRKARNEERKRVLTDNGALGMKYTAIAMASTNH